MLPVPSGLVQIKFSDAKTNQVQLGIEMTYFKLIGTLGGKENSRCSTRDYKPTLCLRYLGTSGSATH